MMTWELQLPLSSTLEAQRQDCTVVTAYAQPGLLLGSFICCFVTSNASKMKTHPQKGREVSLLLEACSDQLDASQMGPHPAGCFSNKGRAFRVSGPDSGHQTVNRV